MVDVDVPPLFAYRKRALVLLSRSEDEKERIGLAPVDTRDASAAPIHMLARVASSSSSSTTIISFE